MQLDTLIFQILKRIKSFYKQLITIFSLHYRALIICSLGFILFGAILFYKYFFLQYYDWDLAFFTQAMWNLSHGRQFVSLFGCNFFGNHSNFIAYFILPVFKIFPSALTLLFLKLTAFISGGFLLYWISKDDIGEKNALLLMLIYFLYLPNIYGIVYEFHFENLAIPFLFLLFYYFREKRPLLFFLTALVLMSIKENMPLVVVMFGLWGLLRRGYNRWMWGVLPLLLGGAIFYWLVAVQIPHFSGISHHPYLLHYKDIGLDQSLASPLLDEKKDLLKILFQERNRDFLFRIFFPLLFFPLGSLSIVLPVVPIFLQHLLSNIPEEHKITYHYVLTLAPYLFLATSYSLKKVYDFFKIKGYFIQIGVFLLILLFCNIVNIINAYQTLSEKISLYPTYAQYNENKWELLCEIPDGAPVISTFAFLPHLALRENLYAFHKVYSDNYQNQHRPFIVPENVQYALLDFSDGWIKGKLSKNLGVAQRVRQRIMSFFPKGGWSVKDAAGEVFLFERKKRNHVTFLRISQTPFKGIPKEAPQIFVDKAFSVIPVVVPNKEKEKQHLLSLELYWHSLGNIKDAYTLVFTIISKKNPSQFKIILHNVGYNIYQTVNWQKGDYIKEHYYLPLPTLVPGSYDITLGLFNTTTKKMVKLFSSQPALLRENGTVVMFLTFNVGRVQIGGVK